MHCVLNVPFLSFPPAVSPHLLLGIDVVFVFSRRLVAGNEVRGEAEPRESLESRHLHLSQGRLSPHGRAKLCGNQFSFILSAGARETRPITWQN